MERFKEQRHILGSEADIIIVTSDTERAASLFAQIWSTIEQFEAQFSRFRPDSELSRFNANAGKWTAITPSFARLLQSCQDYAKITNGLFNPFVLPALQQAGYKGSWPSVQQHDPLLDYSNRHITTMSHLELTSTKARIPADSALDFGGIGKGYVLDILAQLMTDVNCTHYIFSLGGDIICAGFDETGKPWNIGIRDARDQTKSVGTITNEQGDSLATASSGILKRSGQNWNHIIDPRTGVSVVSQTLMATVVARTGTAADIFAKSLILDHEFEPVTVDCADEVLATYLQLKDDSTILRQKVPYISEI